MASLNYAELYFRELSQAFPYALYYGALWGTPNNSLYKISDATAKTVKIPSLTTGGRVDSDRDAITGATRKYDNAWETKILTNDRTFKTLVDPVDIIQTNMIATIANITRVFNEQQKFPEMDAYLISKVYSLWAALGNTADTVALTAANVLTKFDAFMQGMDEARVPQAGRILYITPAVNTLLKNAQSIERAIRIDEGGAKSLNRIVSRIDEVEIVVVPSDMMKTAYDFTNGWAVGASALQINMLLIHPLAVITPVIYETVKLDAPSALSDDKYVYLERGCEDVFLLEKKAGAIAFNTDAPSVQG
jgi:hypothetical protein